MTKINQFFARIHKSVPACSPSGIGAKYFYLVKKLLQIAGATFTGGIFFLVPLVLLAMVIEKALSFLQRLVKPLTRHLEHWTVGGIAFHEIVALLLLLLLCLAAGLFARTGIAKQFIRHVENRFLVHIPGYHLAKTIMGDPSSLKSQEDLPIVLAQTDSGWQLAFLIEPINEELFAIFLPDAPSLFSGSVVYAEKSKIRFIDISRQDAIQVIRRMGAGSGKVLKDKL